MGFKTFSCVTCRLGPVANEDDTKLPWWEVVNVKILMKTISWHSHVNSDLCRRRSWVIEDVHRCPLLVGDQWYGFPPETELYRDLRGWRTIRKTQ